MSSPPTSQPSSNLNSPTKQMPNPIDAIMSSEFKDSTNLEKDEVHQVSGVPHNQVNKDSRKVLIGWKNSPEGNKAFDHYVEKVAQAGDHVFLVVVLPTTLFKSAGFGTDDKKMDRKALRELRENAQKLATEKCKVLETKNVTWTLELVHGAKRYVIEWIANRRKVELIVLGRKKSHAFAKGFTKFIQGHAAGSTVLHILQKVDVPVLVVN